MTIEFKDYTTAQISGTYNDTNIHDINSIEIYRQNGSIEIVINHKCVYFNKYTNDDFKITII